MENKFVDYFSKISPLSAEEAEAIAGSMQTKKFKKGDFLIKEGQFSTKTYFIAAAIFAKIQFVIKLFILYLGGNFEF